MAQSGRMPRRREPILLSPWHRTFAIPENVTKDDADPASTFQNAVTLFLSELSEEEKVHFKEFSDPSSMMQDLISHCSKAKSKSRILASCKFIDRFVCRYEPFFEILNIFIQSNPTWAAVALGAIRLMFLVSLQPVESPELMADHRIVKQQLCNLFCKAGRDASSNDRQTT
jgi:hypothetical protein